jgi:serine/threonine protein kinase
VISPDNLTLSKGVEIEGYRLIREIGKSFYGKTFLAYQKSVDRTVALKVFNIVQDHAPASAFDSLKKEIFKTANVDHPGIMHYFDCGMQSNHVFLSMPYLSEGNLAAKIAKQGKIPLEQTLNIATRTAETLNAMLKSSGGLHLSLNPSNIVFNDNSDMLLCEYGIKPWKMKFCIKNESATDWSRYDSPEIRNAESASHLSDIYSIGVLLSEMLSGLSTGGKPFDREAALDIKGSPELVEIIRMTTEESPALRAQTYEAILKVLQHLRKKHGKPAHGGGAQGPAKLIKPPLQLRKIVVKSPSQR